MKRIIIHWTAGFGSPNFVDKKHYHYLIGLNGKHSVIIQKKLQRFNNLQ